MDISKASNFERFVYDLTGHDAAETRRLFDLVRTQQGFDLRTTEYYSRLADDAIVSGSSTHQQRLACIRAVHERTGRVIDTHTADGVNVALLARSRGLGGKILCAQTALAAKFGTTIEEALGMPAPRPNALLGLEDRPQRVVEMNADAADVMAYIEATIAAPLVGG